MLISFVPALGMGILSSLLGGSDLTDRLPDISVEARVTSIFSVPDQISTQQASITAEMELPNACFRLGRTTTQIHPEQRVILLHQEALKTSTNCSQEPVLDTKVIELGHLKSGTYEIRNLKSLKRLGRFEIKDAKHLVQNENQSIRIDSAEVQSDTLGFRRLITVKGALLDSCLRFRPKAAVQFEALKPGVVGVLPQLEPAKTCADQKEIAFLRTFEIPDSIASGKYLFYIPYAQNNHFSFLDSIETDVQISRRVDDKSLAKTR